MDRDTHQRLRRLALRHARRAQDADDLLQDTLLAGLQAGRDDEPWLAGTLRHLAALQARGALRRRRREADAALPPVDAAIDAHAIHSPDPAPFLRTLPPAARRVAVLALHGLDAAEIRWILGLPDTAFRQRLTRIRRALGELPPAQRAQARALAFVRDPARVVDLQFGLVRRALKAALAAGAGLASHDPDGHLLVVRGAHGSAPRGNGN